MPSEHRQVLEYAAPGKSKPLRVWIPIACLFVAFLVWNWPQLTPTSFPNSVDISILILLIGGAFAMGKSTSLPLWAISLFGGSAVCLFLLANFNDNNFRSNTTVSDILLPWSAMIIVGVVVACSAAVAGRGSDR